MRVSSAMRNRRVEEGGAVTERSLQVVRMRYIN